VSGAGGWGREGGRRLGVKTRDWTRAELWLKGAILCLGGVCRRSREARSAQRLSSCRGTQQLDAQLSVILTRKQGVDERDRRPRSSPSPGPVARVCVPSRPAAAGT
jgi:hypothetical protein